MQTRIFASEDMLAPGEQSAATERHAVSPSHRCSQSLRSFDVHSLIYESQSAETFCCRCGREEEACDERGGLERCV